MSTPLRTLLVEDSEDDAWLVLAALRQGGYEPVFERVQTAPAIRTALTTKEWDIVLCDYSMPGFDALAALRLLQETGLELPLIIVSGTIGEDAAVAAMKLGAADYLLKDRLTRLGQAIGHALEQGRLRREQKRALEALKREQALFNSLVSTIPDCIYFKDRESRFLYINDMLAQRFGLRATSEALGKTDDDFFTGEHARKSHADEQRIMETGEPVIGIEEKETWPDGHVTWVSTTKVPLRDGEGRIIGLVGVSRDITEKKLLEEKFLHAQRLEAVGTLASGIAHDLNNILAPMLMAAGLLKHKLADQRDREILAMVENGANRGANIIRQLLTFSRDSGGARGNIQPRHLLRELVNIIQETFPRNIVIEQAVPSDLWTVVADPTQLHQVLLNLCVNARDAMPKGGKLAFRAENVQLSVQDVQAKLPAKPGPYLRLTVSDTGQGIPPDIIGRIFDPFFTTKGPGKGTGLGLSTVYSIVKDHGGFVTVASELGRGTIFKVHLPAIIDSVPAPAHVSTAPMPFGQGELVLVVDDEAAIRESICGILENHGYRTLAAGNGEEAIKLYIQHGQEVQLVLTDVLMPLMDGVELIRALRILEPGVRVIACSGMELEEKQTELKGLGIAVILAKPFTPSSLLRALEQVRQ